MVVSNSMSFIALLFPMRDGSTHRFLSEDPQCWSSRQSPASSGPSLVEGFSNMCMLRAGRGKVPVRCSSLLVLFLSATLFSIGLDSYWSSPVQSDPAANWLPPNGNCITLPVAVFSLFCAWLSAKHSLSNPKVLWYRYEGRWRTISKVGDPLNTHADLNHYLRH